MSEEIQFRYRFATTDGGTRLARAGEKVRLTIRFPDGSAWVEWTKDDARAIRDALTEWLEEES